MNAIDIYFQGKNQHKEEFENQNSGFALSCKFQLLTQILDEKSSFLPSNFWHNFAHIVDSWHNFGNQRGESLDVQNKQRYETCLQVLVKTKDIKSS